MNDTLKQLIVYIVSKFPFGVGRTRLMKLLFLVDMLAERRLGERVTGVEWVRWKYGPFSAEVLEALDELVEEGKLIVDTGAEVRYKAYTTEARLDPEVRELADFVVREYGFLSLTELLKNVYSKYRVAERGMGERIEVNWKGEIRELAAEASGGKGEALRELVGRLSESYARALEVMPGNILTLLAMALSSPHLGRETAESIVEELLGVLEAVEKYLEEQDDNMKPLPEELKARVDRVYQELLEYAAKALEPEAA